MSATAKSKAAYEYFKAGKTAKGHFDTVKAYYDVVMAALDEDTRSGALFKGGLKVTTDIAKQVLGASLTSHPYYVLHRTHFDVLVRALNASDAHANAQDALTRAVAAADSTAAVRNILEGFVHRRNYLLFCWQMNLAELLRLQADHAADPSGTLPAIQNVGLTPTTLTSRVDVDLPVWRGDWFLLVQDATELSLMIGAESRVAEEAMKRYDEKIRKLNAGGALGRIAARSLEHEREFDMLDRMRPGASKSKPTAALQDPARFAEERRREVDALTVRLVNAGDIALSDLPTRAPDQVTRRLLGALAMQ